MINASEHSFEETHSFPRRQLLVPTTRTRLQCYLLKSSVGPAMIELAQGSRGSLPEAELDRYGRVIELRCAQPTESPIVADFTEVDPFKFVRLSSETFPDLKGRELECLSDICVAAHHSEEFFLSVGTNQWVRTAITCDAPSYEIFSKESIDEERSKLISTLTIHSNVLPCDPLWTKFQAIRDGASKRVHFPYSILKEAVQEGNTLMKKVLEWREKREKCEISNHGLRRSDYGSSRLFWAIGADVKPLKQFDEGSDGTVWQVEWRGGVFVRKDSLERDSHNQDDPGPSSDPSSDLKDAFDTELNVVERLSHPHIVYSFGVSYGVNKRSLFMEYMQGDLSQLILDRVRTTGDNEPPFLHQESVDILLQIAKGVDHMHKENVIHGDLKSRNILISNVSISENVKHYLVKVADFGSAQLVSSNFGSIGFEPASGTTFYAAPEVLKFRDCRDELTFFPYQLDVYSFGIVAYEVLTGEELYKDLSSSLTKLKKGVMQDNLRPPLRAECEKDNFPNNEKLISLIESCWHHNPSERPPFEKIVEVLDSVRVQILEAPTSLSNHPPRQANFYPTNTSGAHDEAVFGSNGHHPSPPVQPISTSDALHAQVRKPTRRWKFMRFFSCVSGGKVQS